MSDKRTFILAHAEARRRALECVAGAPDGYAVVVSDPTRTLEQNALMWVLLEAFAKQLEWPVNGRMERLKSEEWKDILSSAFDLEATRVSPGLNGGMVLLGKRTSKYGKRRFAEFVTFIESTAAERGVRLDDKPGVSRLEREADEWLGVGA